MSDESDLRLRGWGRCMLLEFAAKQQVVPPEHMFSDTITPLDSRQLCSLVGAARALDAGQADGEAFRRLIQFDGNLENAAALLRKAAGPLDAEHAGMALAFAYVPFEVVDAFAVNAVVGASVKRLAAAIDPGSSLPTRTRLFLADNLRKEATVRGLVSCTASIVALRANAFAANGASLIARYARGRLRRLAFAAEGLRCHPAIMAEALRCCLANDWWNAQALTHHIAERAGIQSNNEFRNPPALADLLLIAVMPTCDTIDAVERLLRAPDGLAAAGIVH